MEENKQKSKEKPKEKTQLMKRMQRHKQQQRSQKQRKTDKSEKTHKISSNMRKIGDYEIDLDKNIGFGTFGTVYRAYKQQNYKISFACKHIHKNKIGNVDIYKNGKGKSNKERLDQEIATHKRLSSSDHIVNLYDVMEENDGYYLFMEMCDSDLGKLLKDKGCLSEQKTLFFFKQLINGYRFLYQLKISHRDLKPQNLLLTGKILKISDFGFVKQYQNIQSRPQSKSKLLTQSIAGSINYMAPQILKAELENTKYNPFLSDVWSMGVILYKMLYNKQPYAASSAQQLLSTIQNKKLVIPQEPAVSNKTVNLIKQMIQKDTKLRITFQTLNKLICEEQPQQKKQKEKDDQVLKSQKQKHTSDSKYNEKQKQLMFYNLLMTKISSDSANFATIREIGIQQYQKFSSRLMSLIHEKRVNLLQKTQDIDVNDQIKNQISVYANTFHQGVKYVAELDKFQGGLLSLLTIYREKLADYEQFSMLHKNVQYCLLLLLLIYNLEKKNISMDYIFTVMENQKNKKMTLNLLEKIKDKNLSK